jgi:formylglycine-generating enzyme required for sulfatase activity
MANSDFYREPTQNLSSFDDALLDIIIKDSEHNVELQNLVNMTAQTIFEKPVNMTVSATAEQAFLNSYNEAWILTLLKNKFFIFLSGVIILSLLIIPQLDFKTTPPASKLTAAPVVYEQEKETPNQEDSIVVEQTPLKHVEAIQQDPVPVMLATPPLHKVPKPSVIETTVTQKDTLYEVMDQDRYSDILMLHGDPTKDLLKYFDVNQFGIELYRYNMYSSKYEWLVGEQESILNLPLYRGNPFAESFGFMQYISAYEAEHPQRDAIKPIPKGMSRWFQDPQKNSPQAKSKFENRAHPLYYPDGLIYQMPFPEQATGEEVYDYFSQKENLDKLSPFYFSKTFVSNQDYQEFLYWVRKYNGFDSVPSKDQYTEAYTYTFHVKNQEIIDRYGVNSVYVYPDSSMWVKHFPRSYMHMMSEYYLDHPAFRTYPVVGLNYYQSLAYCDWLTWIWQSRLDAASIPIEVEFDLPYAYERELAARELLKRNDFLTFENLPLSTIYSDLLLTEKVNRVFRRSLGHDNGYNDGITGNTMNSIGPNPVYAGGLLKKDPNFIYGMENSVSVWLKDDFDANYIAYEKALESQLLNGKYYDKGSSTMLITLRDYFLETCNTEGGKMVQGANWYDERLRRQDFDANKSIWPKAFVSPDSAFATVGVRFVMRIKLKDEAKIRKKVQTFGHALPLMDYTMVDDEYQRKGNYMVDPNGFKFVPMGTLPNGTSVQAFYAKINEVTNFEWMLFLNDLIEYGRDEDLAKCIPTDSMWAYKMRYETNDTIASGKRIFDGFEEICFPKSCIKANQLDEIPLTTFAMMPVTGISKEAAILFTRWLTDIYIGESESTLPVRLPYDSEWMAMSSQFGKTGPYPWGGPYTRNYQGIFLANYDWNTVHLPDSVENTADINATSKPLQGYWPVMHFAPDGYGLYDLSGNVAEMILDKTYTRGGSWASSAEDIKINATEAWDGLPSSKVGFRVVITYLGK